ncbi:hypothetical protein PRIPAC_82428, partial [Pristionchus pacificus]|uniref:Uncharacterized protein n=1 Tax=Pristionchus pacificus TaxID=54126 RepID=A0A2A6C1W6_PRIPA
HSRIAIVISISTLPLLAMLLIWMAILLVGARAELQQRQCLCTEVERCRAAAEQGIEHCAEKCKSHATKLGVNGPAARQCVLDQRPRIEKAVACVTEAFGTVCTQKAGPMITRRFPETIQLAAFREVTSMLNNAGLLSEATSLIAAAKGAAACAMKCGKEHPCYKILCSLALPSDNDIVATVKKCAIDAGFTTPVAKEICVCLVNAGLKQISTFCPRLIIE